MEIYIKQTKKVSLTSRTKVLLKDVAEVVSSEKNAADIEIMNISSQKKTNILISAVDIIRQVKRVYPQATVLTVGECDTLVQYSPHADRDNKVLEWLKVIFVAVVLFSGSATAIMSFYTDAQMNQVFENMHYIITGQKTDNPLLIAIPYCFGIAVGIIVFFNHAAGKKLDSDPTPIEVEMSSYESDVTNTVIDAMASERRDGDN